MIYNYMYIKNWVSWVFSKIIRLDWIGLGTGNIYEQFFKFLNL